jgi:hypothetical protein
MFSTKISFDLRVALNLVFATVDCSGFLLCIRSVLFRSYAQAPNPNFSLGER